MGAPPGAFRRVAAIACYDFGPVCGRFSLHILDLDELREPFALDRIEVEGWTPRYNVAPIQQAPVVVQRPERALVPMRWGLVPRWAVDPAAGAKAINARIETAAERPSFREAMAQRRCVVPATGFFEWKRLRGKRAKQPMWIHRRDGGLLAFAGLWERWGAPDGTAIESFAIVTRDASGFVRDIHDRMPVTLSAPWVTAWLDPEATPAQLTRALGAVAGDVATLEAVPVAAIVNSPAHDVPECIAPVVATSTLGQLDLFGEDGL